MLALLLALPVLVVRAMLGAVKTNAADMATAWQTGMAGAGTKYKAGVAAVKVAPGQLAAAASDRYLSGVSQNVDKFKSKVSSVSLGQWQTITAAKGADRLGTGAQAALPKFQAFAQKFIGTLTSVVDGLPPRGSYEANMARQRAFADALHAQAGNF